MFSNNSRNLFSNNSRTCVQIIREYINLIIRAFFKKVFYSNSRPRIIRAGLIIRAFKVEKNRNSRAQYSSN